MKFYAHENQSLAAHLKGVAERAAAFASFFESTEHGRLAGLLHDLGKAEDEFQKRIQTGNDKGRKEPHAHHGAALLLQDDPKRGGPVWPVAFAINAHHAGLHDRSNLQKRTSWRERALAAEERLVGDPDWSETSWPLGDFGKNLPDWLEKLPFSTPEERAMKLRAVDLYTRFLFSALIDADRLDTEAHDRETSGSFMRRHAWRFREAGLAAEEAPEKLLVLLESAIQKRRHDAESKGTSADVLEVRERVLDACKTAALKQQRAVFTLTVPTGGGKTLASVYFALRHIAAQNQREADPHHKLRRIIVVIPYLNIIQQTVLELVDAFQHTEEDPVVLEHHSQAQDPATPSGKQADKGDADDYSRERTLRQLAAENWDAPIVVTTSVQFFDSLFSRRPADGRKLHNIAQSVVIFDEVQTFPPRLMQPILDALGELNNPERPYGCSLVLCTATQPALLKSGDFPCGFDDVKHIVETPVREELFRRLERTSYPELENKGDIPQRAWPELASEILKAPNSQGLVIVNTRRHARELFEELRESDQRKHKDAVFHLSTWMTPAHRVEVLTEVRRRLNPEEPLPCFLVSTQCIEAGVDVDFPAVWRAFGPYDAIVQAAGRCNRNGRIETPEDAQVHVFRPQDESLPSGVYRTATSQTELLRRMGAANPHDPNSFDTYFRLLYQLSVPDECEIQHEREQLHFEQVHDRFNFIESFSTPLLILSQTVEGQPSDTPARAIYERAHMQNIPGTKARGYFTRDDWRRLQPYILSVDFRQKVVEAALARYSRPAFDSTDLELRIWDAGSAGYVGGLHGAGWNWEIDAELSNLLVGGL